jgi:NAD(P)-dependent dehydrogenase (short-subunit alcohol dehydrogenase family)
MQPVPDHGEHSYRGSGRLAGKKAVISGADSGIGRAVAIAHAREGADVFIAYLSEDEDTAETKKWVEQAGRKAVLMRGDVQDANHCRAIIDKAISELGAIDVLVNNAAHQASFKSIDDISRFDETDQEGDDVCCQVSEQSIGSTWEFGLNGVIRNIKQNLCRTRN